jgi:ATP:ADP antiporter, AAA family
MNTTRQALFLPVDRDSKYDGKTAIDTFFWRFGDLLQAGGIFVGLHLFGWHSHEFAILTFGLSLVWIWLAAVMGRDYSLKAQQGMVNVAPQAVERIPDLLYAPGEPFQHVISPKAFYDAEPGDVLKLRARRDDGSDLPHWMHFHANVQEFHGKPPAHVEVTEMRIVVTAVNLDGLEAHSTFTARRRPD